jgi:asparagine synthase (glutamine-hydrolysing)
MCGICGTIPARDESPVRAMNAAMRRRGPDDEGIYLDQEAHVALGARRLSIIDVEGGHQPLANEDGTVWAALNGEIYNHPALQSWLRNRGHKLRTRTDTEVLVHLYEEFGDALVHSLEGMFAFALWDAERRRLLIGRDRFGEKPLVYSERPGGGLVFASELTALLAAGQVNDELDPASVDQFFVFGYVPGPASILRQVKQLPAGHVLTWTHSDCCRVSRYWSPPESTDAGERFDSLVAETRHLLERSVSSRMVSDVRLGVFLSGGVDSTLIAALAARGSSRPIKTFTVGYDVGDVSETAPARRVSELIGSDHHELVLTEREAAAQAAAVLAGVDQPLGDAALTPLNAVAELARREVTVTIGGEGADELFAGYPKYRWVTRAAQADRVLPRTTASLAAAALERLPASREVERLAAVLGPCDLLERQLAWVGGGRPPFRQACYGERLEAERASTRPLELMNSRLDGVPRSNPAATLMRLDQRQWLPDDVLMKADRAGMLVSLEIRTPYLHRELAELAAAVSPRVHMRNGGKALLRSVLAQVLPEADSRPKTAFRVPIDSWLRGPLAPTLVELIAGGRAFAEGWFDRDAVAGMAREHRESSRDRSRVLWPILAFGLWLEGLRDRG